MKKTLTLDGAEYTVAPIDVDTAEELGSGKGFNRRLVAASLRAGGTTITDEQVGKMPFYVVFMPLLHATQEVNGLKEPGEAQAGDQSPASSGEPSAQG